MLHPNAQDEPTKGANNNPGIPIHWKQPRDFVDLLVLIARRGPDQVVTACIKGYTRKVHNIVKSIQEQETRYVKAIEKFGMDPTAYIAENPYYFDIGEDGHANFQLEDHAADPGLAGLVSQEVSVDIQAGSLSLRGFDNTDLDKIPNKLPGDARGGDIYLRALKRHEEHKGQQDTAIDVDELVDLPTGTYVAKKAFVKLTQLYRNLPFMKHKPSWVTHVFQQQRNICALV